MEDFYDFIAKGYGSNQYNDELLYLDSIDSPKLEKEIVKAKNKNVLEIGAGVGRITKKIFDASPLYLQCVEPSLESKKILAKLFPKVKVSSSVEGVKNNQFDYIFVVQTLIHIKNKSNFIKQLSRLLLPGGKLVLSILAQEKPLYAEAGTKKIYQDIYPNKIEDIKNYLRLVGLKVVDEDKVSVDNARINLFGSENLGKILSWYIVAENI